MAFVDEVILTIFTILVYLYCQTPYVNLCIIAQRATLSVLMSFSAITHIQIAWCYKIRATPCKQSLEAELLHAKSVLLPSPGQASRLAYAWDLLERAGVDTSSYPLAKKKEQIY